MSKTAEQLIDEFGKGDLPYADLIVRILHTINDQLQDQEQRVHALEAQDSQSEPCDRKSCYLINQINPGKPKEIEGDVN